MITKIMPVYRMEFVNRDQRDATNGARRKPQQKITFKEVFSQALSGVKKR
jgi:hypothetical protein